MTRFKNININDVWALRNSCSHNKFNNNGESDSDGRNSSSDSIKMPKPPYPVPKVSREMIASQSNPSFRRKRSIRTSDDNEPYNIFLKNCKNKSLIPSPMGVVKKSKEVNEVIKLNEYKIGDEYANAFAQSLKATNNKIVHLNMKN